MIIPIKSDSINFKVFSDYNELSSSAAEYVVNLLLQAIAERGSFHIALAGGSTPRQLYERLLSPRFSDRIPWNKVHFYLGDERFVPPDHEDSNYRMMYKHLFYNTQIPPENIHRFATELKDPVTVAQHYAKELETHLPRSQTQNGDLIFDLVLLGVGSDGHTASLFPGTSILNEYSAPVAAVFVPQLASWRISITFPLIQKARNVLALICGSEKAPIVNLLINNSEKEQSQNLLPIQTVAAIRRNLDCYADQSAAAILT